MESKIVVSRKRIGIVLVAALIIVLFGYVVNEKNKDKMVLDSHIKAVDILNPMDNSGELLLRVQEKGAVFLSAEETHQYFSENLGEWVVQKLSTPQDLRPDMTLYLNLAEDYKVMFFDSKPELAMVQHRNHYQYFRMPKGVYEKLTYDYSIRSYLVVEPLMAAIADGKLSKRESVNDTPVNVSFKAAQIGNFTYYFYEQSGKYYVEAPYFFIKELSKEVYEKAITAIPQ